MLKINHVKQLRNISQHLLKILPSPLSYKMNICKLIIIQALFSYEFHAQRWYFNWKNHNFFLPRHQSMPCDLLLKLWCLNVTLCSLHKFTLNLMYFEEAKAYVILTKYLKKILTEINKFIITIRITNLNIEKRVASLILSYNAALCLLQKSAFSR